MLSTVAPIAQPVAEVVNNQIEKNVPPAVIEPIKPVIDPVVDLLPKAPSLPSPEIPPVVPAPVQPIINEVLPETPKVSLPEITPERPSTPSPGTPVPIDVPSVVSGRSPDQNISDAPTSVVVTPPWQTEAEPLPSVPVDTLVASAPLPLYVWEISPATGGMPATTGAPASDALPANGAVPPDAAWLPSEQLNKAATRAASLVAAALPEADTAVESLANWLSWGSQRAFNFGIILSQGPTVQGYGPSLALLPLIALLMLVAWRAIRLRLSTDIPRSVFLSVTTPPG